MLSAARDQPSHGREAGAQVVLGLSKKNASPKHGCAGQNNNAAARACAAF